MNAPYASEATLKNIDECITLVHQKATNKTNQKEEITKPCI